MSMKPGGNRKPGGGGSSIGGATASSAGGSGGGGGGGRHNLGRSVEREREGGERGRVGWVGGGEKRKMQ